LQDFKKMAHQHGHGGPARPVMAGPAGPLAKTMACSRNRSEKQRQSINQFNKTGTTKRLARLADLCEVQTDEEN
jgi:hypothetical protein